MEHTLNAKEKKADRFIGRIKRLAHDRVSKGNYECALEAISVGAQFLYQWNQSYYDKEFEGYLLDITNNCVHPGFSMEETIGNRVLFYDSFGLDQRGLALIYLKALCELGYEVIYVTNAEAEDRQPTLAKVLAPYPVKWEYLDTRDFIGRAIAISGILDKYKPQSAFMQLMPWDVAAIIAFNGYSDLIERYQINLTDHAFWLGLNAFDYCIEFRDYGANVSAKYRGIDKDRIVKIPYYPYFDKDMEFQGFDEDLSDRKIVFSGGSLYKTFGDPENRYYKIIDGILSNNKDAVFIFACNNDSKGEQFDKLRQKYPGRIKFINERKDLYQVIRHTDLYLSTFPVFGGLMVQYAAIAGRLPLTLLNPTHTLDGLLLNLNELDIEFENYEDLIAEATKLLKNDRYRREREKTLERSVITEQEFRDALKAVLLKKHRYNIRFQDNIDTRDFRSIYIDNFNFSKTSTEVLYYYWNTSIKFPWIFTKILFSKISKRIGLT